MATPTDEEIKQMIDEMAKGNTTMILNPELMERMKKMGLPIREEFVRYEDYIEKLYSKKKKLGLILIRKLPKLDSSIANSTVTQIYSEIRDSLAFEDLTSTIINSILLLEFAMRLRMFREIVKSNPQHEWKLMEQLDFDALVSKLIKHGVIPTDVRGEFDEFRKKFRNPYFHMNIYKMAKGATIPELDAFNFNTGQKEKLKNVPLDEHPELWFAAKIRYDNLHVFDIMDFCVYWTNQLLANI